MAGRLWVVVVWAVQGEEKGEGVIQTPKGFQLHAARQFWAGPQVLLYGFARGGMDYSECYRLTDVTFTKVTKETDGQDSPPLRLDETAAQVLMDTLWNCGIRPTEGAGTAGAMAAAQANLEDLRTANAKLLDAVICKLTGKAKA